MSSKVAAPKSSDPKDDKPTQKPNVSLEEDDEFEDFPVEGELIDRCQTDVRATPYYQPMIDGRRNINGDKR
jgi:hypothetical protein